MPGVTFYPLGEGLDKLFTIYINAYLDFFHLNFDSSDQIPILNSDFMIITHAGFQLTFTPGIALNLGAGFKFLLNDFNEQQYYLDFEISLGYTW